jgi:transposase
LSIQSCSRCHRRVNASCAIYDGTLELDTNCVEREMRPICITRKAALFAGSAGGGETWAIAATLIRTAILNGVNPQAWLADVLGRMVRGEVRATELASLLPWTWHQPGTAAAA